MPRAMTIPRFALGAVLLAVTVGAMVMLARRVRALALPGVPGPLAALADAVLALASLLALAHVLGALGALDPLPLTAACATAGAAAWRLLPPPRSTGERAHAPVAAAVPALGIVAVVWAGRTIDTLERGVSSNLDTNWYHLPLAARFVQEGIGGLYRSYEPLVGLYPADASLLHAVGIAQTATDALSPLVNLGLLALALLAGIAIGRLSATGPLPAAALALVFVLPALSLTQPAEGKDDTMVLALLLAGAALVALGRPAAAAVGGLALGVAIGTKLTAVPVALVLAASAVFLVTPRERRRTALLMAAALVAAGSVWYLRNLVETGSPLPMVAVPGWDPPPSPALDGPLSTSVAHYATDFGVWREWFIPGLRTAFGPLWFVLIAASVTGIVAGLRRPGAPRAFAAAALVGLAAFVTAPHMAGGPEGQPFYFEFQVRHALPALVLGMMAGAWTLGATRASRSPWPGLAIAAIAGVTVAATDYDWPATELAVGAALLALAAGVGLLAPARYRAAAGSALVAVVVLAVGVRYHDGAYLRGDYREASMAEFGMFSELADAFRWARTVTDARIGVIGTTQHYPLYGADLSNRVSQVGIPGPRGAYSRARTCEEFARALADGGFRYVVAAPAGVESRGGLRAPPEAAWLGDGGARRILAAGDGAISVHELRGPLSCGPR